MWQLPVANLNVCLRCTNFCYGHSLQRKILAQTNMSLQKLAVTAPGYWWSVIRLNAGHGLCSSWDTFYFDKSTVLCNIIWTLVSLQWPLLFWLSGDIVSIVLQCRNITQLMAVDAKWRKHCQNWKCATSRMELQWLAKACRGLLVAVTKLVEICATSAQWITVQVVMWAVMELTATSVVLANVEWAWTVEIRWVMLSSISILLYVFY